MNKQTRTLNSLTLRIFGIILHAFANFILVSYLVDFDITGSWIVFIGFVLVVFLLSYIFLKHLVTFINFIINK